MYVVASGPGDPGGAGSSRRLRRASPGLLFAYKRSLFNGVGDRSVVFQSSPRRRGFLRRMFGRGDPEPVRSVSAPPGPMLSLDEESTLSGPSEVLDDRSPTPPPSPATEIRGIASGSCPKCHVPYLPAGTTGRWGCPFCGRHATTVGVPTPAVETTRPGRSERAGDPRHEELLAAWMIGGPLPCPQCRAGLRHTTGGDFSCPACGERVRLEELSAGARAPVPVP